MVVATADGLMARTLPPETLRSLAITLEVGGQAELGALAEQLLSAGYTRCEQVEGVGQFALRGGILDVFSPLMDQPVRCEFFDDEIDSMGAFDPGTQRRTRNVSSARILPAAEVLPHCAPGGLPGLADQLTALAEKLAKKQKTEAIVQTLREDAERLRSGAAPGAADRYLAAIYPTVTAGVHYLPPDAVVFLSESGRVDERVKNTVLQQKQDVEALLSAGVLAGEYAHLTLTAEELYAALEDFPVILEDSLPTSRHPLRPRGLLTMNAKQLSSYGGSLETAVTDLEHYRSSGSAVLVLCGGETRAKNLHRLLEEKGIPATLDLSGAAMPAAGEVRLSLGALSAGSEWPALKLAVLTEGQLTAPAMRKRQRVKKDSNRQKLQSYTDLSPGDLVVHEHHGVGRFVGIQRMPVDGVEKDYIKIDYAGGDCLYVPVTQLDLVSKYIGGGEDTERTKLNKLGGAEWTRQKTKAKKAAKDLARGLIALYAERQKRPGFAFSPDSPWQREFEESFDYTETDDQLRCIAEIKADMEKPRPMDRLLCGDVGYGKTEVALRAVMKCILDGKQAAILVPTTVLAQQHYQTALQRFFGFPVNIAVLSRFKTGGQTAKTLADIASGKCDLVIGTHRLLSKDVRFKNLGLLVVDEEQRFGVSHKEHIKELSEGVDVLTLSATPIPRTLNMAMSGIRDMSTLEEPPEDRLPVQTFVMEHDWGVIADAIRREIQRGGQVYYLHNRIDDIERTAKRLTELLEDVTVAVAHGQMDKTMLANVMENVANGQIQVLVCTTIIETGIDIPNVNTLIIEDADHLGLAQLHQIRGRVGRSTRRASAYLTFRRDKVLTEVAEKRLNAIRDFAQFGSGFKIAMRDLEIRGAGNLLGAEQSGHMIDVGYDMYMKLLSEAVLEARGIQPPQRADCSADLAVAANIPDRYIPASEQRMDIYRRIALIRSEEEADDLTDELIDRFGDPPPGVNALVHVALLRGEAGRAGITDISQKQGYLRFTVKDFDMEKVSALYAMPQYKGRLKVEAGSKPCLSLRIKAKGRVIDEARRFTADWGGYGAEQKK